MKTKTDFKNAVSQTYSKYNKTILAFSGGADSTLLFYLLLDYQKENPSFCFEVFHLNHKLRKEATEDADFIQSLCEKYTIKGHIFEKNIQKYASSHKQSVEEAGRYWRYFYLNQLLKEQSFDSITTAHHQDDSLETFFLRLLMYPSMGALAKVEKNNNIRRPLLEFSKQEILHELKRREASFKQDFSNFESKYPRNFLRNEIFPKLEEKFPAFKDKIFQFQEILGEKLDFLNSFLVEWKKESNYELSLNFKDFFSIPKQLYTDEILLGLKLLSPNFYLSFKELKETKERLINLKKSQKQYFILKSRFELLSSYSKLFWIKKDFYDFFFIKERDDFKNEIAFAESQFLLKSKKAFKLKEPEIGEKIEFNGHYKKVKDVLIDFKVYAHHRKLCRLILDEAESCLGILNPCLAKVYSYANNRDLFKIRSLKNEN